MKGMIFRAKGVRALLAGTKTQTRRLLPAWLQDQGDEELIETKDGTWRPILDFARYQPGEVVYAKETWAVRSKDKGGRPHGSSLSLCVSYRADGEVDDAPWVTVHPPRKWWVEFPRASQSLDRWSPSIHMPEWAARLYLRIKDVRVERLQDISEDDIIEEGVGQEFLTESARRSAWHVAWVAMHGAASWEANPYVWVYGFEVVPEVERFVAAGEEQA